MVLLANFLEFTKRHHCVHPIFVVKIGSSKVYIFVENVLRSWIKKEGSLLKNPEFSSEIKEIEIDEMCLFWHKMK